jgi:methionine-R-sulfoxide reductase
VTTYERTPAAISGLSPEQYRVAQQNGTEPPGTGDYLHNKEPGIYVDIVSGEPLFASTNKFESGCGWPSFTKPIEPANVKELPDTTLGMVRTEVRAQGQATVILGMSLTMALPIVAAYAIALTLPHFGSFIAMIWRPRATGLTLIRWRNHDERRTRHPRRRMLLGYARPYSQARRRDRSPTASGGMGGATERGRLRFRSSALRREQSYKGSLASIKLGA